MRNSPPHWASQYVGCKWSALGRGPLVFDCWGLCWWVERTHFKRDMDPLIINPLDLDKVSATVDEQIQSGSWTELTTPVDGAIVALSKNATVSHVGVFLALDSGVVLHAMVGKGVLCQRVNTLSSLGYSTIKFYFNKNWSALCVP